MYGTLLARIVFLGEENEIGGLVANSHFTYDRIVFHHFFFHFSRTQQLHLSAGVTLLIVNNIERVSVVVTRSSLAFLL